MTAKELAIEAFRRSDARDLEGFVGMFAPDCEWVAPGTEARGHDALREYLQPFWLGFSRYHHEISRTVEGGDDVVAVEGTWNGVNDGPLLTPEGQQMPATGRAVTLHFVMVGTRDADSELIRSVHLYFDQIEFLGQLGLLPEPAAAA
ncbi:MAG TPA: nuclear transport factor 2 family protein [Solirubrobacteraceae bacterium]